MFNGGWPASVLFSHYLVLDVCLQLRFVFVTGKGEFIRASLV